MRQIYAVDKKHKRILYFSEAADFQHHGVLGQQWGVITKNVGVNYIPTGERSGKGHVNAGRYGSISKKKSNSTDMESRLQDRRAYATQGAKGRTFEKALSTTVPAAILAAGTAYNFATGNPFAGAFFGAIDAAFIGASIHGAAERRANVKADNARRENLEFDKKTGFRLKDHPTSEKDIRDDMDKANPCRNTMIKNFNYAGAAMAFELRRQGYDVRAKQSGEGAGDLNSIRSAFGEKNFKLLYQSNSKESMDAYNGMFHAPRNRACGQHTMAALKQQPPGTRGILTYYSVSSGYGGAVNYTVGSEGKLKFYNACEKESYSQGTMTMLLDECTETSAVITNGSNINMKAARSIVE